MKHFPKRLNNNRLNPRCLLNPSCLSNNQPNPILQPLLLPSFIFPTKDSPLQPQPRQVELLLHHKNRNGHPALKIGIVSWFPNTTSDKKTSAFLSSLHSHSFLSNQKTQQNNNHNLISSPLKFLNQSLALWPIIITVDLPIKSSISCTKELPSHIDHCFIILIPFFSFDDLSPQLPGEIQGNNQSNQKESTKWLRLDLLNQDSLAHSNTLTPIIQIVSQSVHHNHHSHNNNLHHNSTTTSPKSKWMWINFSNNEFEFLEFSICSIKIWKSRRFSKTTEKT